MTVLSLSNTSNTQEHSKYTVQNGKQQFTRLIHGLEVNGVYCNSRQVGQAAPLTLQKLICETGPEKMEVQPLLLLGPWQLAIIKRKKTNKPHFIFAPCID